jgi:hypothetical protein
MALVGLHASLSHERAVTQGFHESVHQLHDLELLTAC